MKIKNIIGQLLLACCFPVFGQTAFSLVADQDMLVFHDWVWERNPKSGKFEHLKDHPTFSQMNPRGNVQACWDGTNLYFAEMDDAKGIRVRYAFNLPSKGGPHWFWRQPVRLSGDCRFMVASDLRALVQERGQKNAQGVPVFRLILLGLEDGATKTILEREDANKTIQASAALRNNDFIVMVNDGSMYQLNAGSSFLRDVKSNFWPELSDLYVQSLTGPKGEKIYQPPQFTGHPFFGSSGEIYFTLQVREKNHWDSKAIADFWEDLTPTEHEKWIAAGKWPIKEGSHEGSNYVAVILKFDTENKLAKVPESEYATFLKQDKYTHQWSWAFHGPAFPLLGQDIHGQFLALESLLSEGEDQTQQPKDKLVPEKKTVTKVPTPMDKPIVNPKQDPTKQPEKPQ